MLKYENFKNTELKFNTNYFDFAFYFLSTKVM